MKIQAWPIGANVGDGTAYKEVEFKPETWEEVRLLTEIIRAIRRGGYCRADGGCGPVDASWPRRSEELKGVPVVD